MKKLFMSILCLTMVLVGITGCGNSSKDSSIEETAQSESKGNYDVFECIKHLDTTNTLEEVNEIIGFEGEYIGKEYEVYYWQLTDDTGVNVQFFDSGSCRIDIDFRQKSIANEKNDFSQFDKISQKLKKGESLKYDEFVQIIGGVEGTLQTKASGFVSYLWVDGNGGYLNGNFNSETLECQSASGMF